MSSIEDYDSPEEWREAEIHDLTCFVEALEALKESMEQSCPKFAAINRTGLGRDFDKTGVIARFTHQIMEEQIKYLHTGDLEDDPEAEALVARGKTATQTIFALLKFLHGTEDQLHGLRAIWDEYK